ncbi:MAG: translation initiation factor IF-3 [Parcubacteria group bacterium]|nr:MAG: translation initiation factor IF-3 [Parcubacteria group bacterium]
MLNKKPNWQSAGRQYRVNEQIRSAQVDVIDEDGTRLGILPTRQAIDLAYEKNIDLVEVSPLSDTPVCKIMDYGKFLYQQRRSQQKNKVLDTKGVRLTFKMGQHDLDIRKAQAEKFLSKGHKVRVELRLRGREKAFRNQAKELITNFINQLSTGYKADKSIEIMGPTLSILIYKK